MKRSTWADALQTFAGFAAATSILVAAGVYAAGDSWPWRKPVDAPLPRVTELFTEQVDTLRRGESVGQLFSRQGLDDFQLAPSAAGGLFDPRRLRAGLVFSFQRRGSDSLPTRVIFRSGPEQRVALVRTDDGWTPIAEPIRWTSEPVVLEGGITTSLYDALSAPAFDALLAPEDRIRLAWDLADVFAWQVDFSRDIQPGDAFRVVAERLIAEDGETRFGRVLAGEVVVGGTAFSAFRWTAGDGTSGFYDAEGRSLRRAFLLAPVQFRRISSSLNRARRHPILGVVRRHEGIDYAADPGTPVMAAGEGVVARREWSGGYGNLVEVRHANGVTTRYGHLQGFAKGLAVGQRVTQGEVIGYVGSTGLATGPHLHYEFRVNGASRSPAGADLGNGDPVPVAERGSFDAERGRLARILDGGAPVYAGRLPDWGATLPSAGADF
ncbi:MAG: M23 family metallopeptidase [Gemmatimonadetes bacterium]|nr:M23 family metallopeptidase [Gemmatimonadota bacterium]MBP6671312.1 M23 family metallopeptidase [Gemmatimonadales bacterium]MBK6778784.1 M23 family metallopeptidase [Gemmatimonadota bacterium]MBK7714468.1 M23 family metallopeptidase [Gemmatimonadota bacterium]MBK7924474.1 M23 family metallopeptidase [Gemmatimonadota bacterium]